MQLVGPVADGVEIIAPLHQGIHPVIHRDEPHPLLREVDLGVVAHLEVFPPQAAEVLDNQGLHLPIFDHLHDLLPRGPLEVGPRVSVIRQEQGVLKPVFPGVLLQQQALERDLSREDYTENTLYYDEKQLAASYLR